MTTIQFSTHAISPPNPFSTADMVTEYYFIKALFMALAEITEVHYQRLKSIFEDLKATQKKESYRLNENDSLQIDPFEDTGPDATSKIGYRVIVTTACDIDDATSILLEHGVRSKSAHYSSCDIPFCTVCLAGDD